MRATALLAVLLLAGIAWVAPRVLVETPYARAERLYQAGDFEKALLLCERELRRSPADAPLRALYTELQFLLGGEVVPGAYDKHFIRNLGVGDSARALAEIDDAFARAERTGDEREWRKILEYAKWMPYDADIRCRADQARACLEDVSGSAASAR